MKIDIVAAALPPQLDGIGDYTSRLSAELAEVANVRVLAPMGRSYDLIEGVEIVPAFSLDRRSGVWTIEAHVRASRADWLLLQYNPFGFGRWGLNLSLPRLLRSIALNCPQTGVAVMIHEAFVPVVNWKFAVMTTWQQWQFRQIGRAAHLLLFSVGRRAEKYRHLFPGKPIVTLPVGSNIPLVPTTRAEARRILGLDDDTIVLGIFGTAHPERLFSHVKAAAEAVLRSNRKAIVLYLGPQGSAVRAALGDVPCKSEGRLDAADISRRLPAVDVFLAPYEDGISTRRTTMMVGLQHGLPVVATRGYHTDPLLLDADGSAFLLGEVRTTDEFCRQVLRLLDDTTLSRRVAAAGRDLFNANFSWPIIAGTLMSQLSVNKEMLNENRMVRHGS